MTPWIDLEGTVLSEISQTEKDKCCMISLICGSRKQTHRISEQTGGCQSQGVEVGKGMKVRLQRLWFFQWSCMDVRVGL